MEFRSKFNTLIDKHLSECPIELRMIEKSFLKSESNNCFDLKEKPINENIQGFN